MMCLDCVELLLVALIVKTRKWMRLVAFTILIFASLIQTAIADIKCNATRPASWMNSIPLSKDDWVAKRIGGSGQASQAYGLNNNGIVVGVYLATSFWRGGASFHGFATGKDAEGFVDLGTLGNGDLNSSWAYSANDRGEVVGRSSNNEGKSYNGSMHAFIAKPPYKELFNLGRQAELSDSNANGISNSGLIVGSFKNSNNNYHAFIFNLNNLTVQKISPLSNDGNISAMAVNEQGLVVGYVAASKAQGGATKPFVLKPDDESIKLLKIPGRGGIPHAVNGRGQIAGGYYIEQTGEEHAFITDADGVKFRDLGTLGGNYSRALAVNSVGMVVGGSRPYGDIGCPSHAFVTGPNGIGLTDINALISLDFGHYFVDAVGINDKGEIVANASNGYAYLLKSFAK